MSFLLWLESTRVATFIRESVSLLGYPTFTTVHTLGLGIIVGLSTVVALRLLGFAPTLPLVPLKKLFPTMWFGFAINTISGSGMLAAAASHLVPHPFFIAKITCVFAAVAILGVLQVRVFRDPEVGTKPLDTMSKVLAGSLLVLWLLAMITGRLIAYTYTDLILR